MSETAEEGFHLGVQVHVGCFEVAHEDAFFVKVVNRRRHLPRPAYRQKPIVVDPPAGRMKNDGRPNGLQNI